MTAVEQKLFRKKKPVEALLLEYGFLPFHSGYRYEKAILDGEFLLSVQVEAGRIETQLVDSSSGEEYILHRVPGASGSFVGLVKQAYEQELEGIAESCFEMDVFQNPVTLQLMDHIRNTYGDELEYLWPRVPENAVWRRKDTKKWYAALLIIPKSKLGLDSEELVEIIDLRILPEQVDALVDGERYFPGFHMNKRHWYTVILDGSVPLGELCALVEESYRLAK